jgi:hypothetical protein
MGACAEGAGKARATGTNQDDHLTMTPTAEATRHQAQFEQLFADAMQAKRCGDDEQFRELLEKAVRAGELMNGFFAII